MKRDKKNAGSTAAGAGGATASAFGNARPVPEGVRMETGRRRASRNGAVVFAVVVFVVAFGIVLALFQAALGGIGLVALAVAAVAGWLAASSVHVVLEWEKAVVLRFGKFNRVAGPGIVFTWPIIEFYTLRIDQRVATTYFGAEETLTSDLVPINVDAVLFWMVWSAKNATVEVEDYSSAVAWIAQTAMRKAIGRATVAEVATRRDQLDEELKEAIEEKLNPWGITIIDVEIRDIVVPKELQEAMAMEAVAERKRNARMVLAEAEKDISEMLKDASEVYDGDQDALRLRTMHLAYESVEKSGGTLVIPSAFSEGFVEGDAEKAAERTARTAKGAGE
ncbi:slipin family protein [Gordonibacter massiliensis (ex Traore et al. 2017)]|uniref:slipin family protein n=1 Tax=Gordonibacter massiliensis (ex Traore et al. 2017) TaxID=1841863 RepID=UPI001C8B9A2F|nr:slipin family protein [Gordonibacter massiliensis (ex Traore et al. 2017)]MBX9034575.1 slipin family protein [Gordonibacter massiliensis (ex Traore et al. 2017)]